MKQSREKTDLSAEKVRLCTECRYCAEPDKAHIEHLCMRPIGASPVTGGDRLLTQPCEMERSAVAYGCGLHARYFQPKEKTQKRTLAERVKALFKRNGK